MTVRWDPDFCARSPMLEPLRAVAAGLRTPYWPACADLNRLAATRVITTGGGRSLTFVEQAARPAAFEDKYEPRIFLRGEAQFRACNWHDLLNALVWLAFPAAKSALNARHYRELERQHACGAPNRGPAQDALTLFDEGGVIVAAADAELAELLVGFEWKELFWRRREAVLRSMRFYLFGHALYEKALAPFAGVTGRGVIFEVEPRLFEAPLAEQLSTLDARLASRIEHEFAATRELAPVPLLGVPGWCDENRDERYYDDTSYFRPARGR